MRPVTFQSEAALRMYCRVKGFDNFAFIHEPNGKKTLIMAYRERDRKLRKAR